MNSDQQKLIEDNQRLVHYFVHKFNTKTQEEYDECAAAGLNGLIKAALTYDKSKNIKFDSYAGTCIQNEICSHLRKKVKDNNIRSFEEIISKEDDNIILEDTIAYTENFDEAENREIFIEVTKILLNYLKFKETLVMLYRMGNITQKCTGEILGFTRGYESQVEYSGKTKIKEIYNKRANNREKLYIDLIGNYYIFLFSYETIVDINNFLKSLLKYLKTIENLPYFKIARNKEYIKIYLLREPESFVTIAQIIQEFSNFIIVGEKSSLYKKTKKDKKITDRNVADTIRKYMLSKDSFTTREIREYFSDKYEYETILNTIYRAKVKGLITKIDTGKYVVNKN